MGVAWYGLAAWKAQSRWQQGRGLAVNLLQSFNAVKRHMLLVLRMRGPRYTDELPSSEKDEIAKRNWELASEFCNQLEEKMQSFEAFALEAKIVWGDDLSFVTIELFDLTHLIRSATLSSAAALNPSVPNSQRQQNASTAEDFWGEIFGYSQDRVGLSKRVHDLGQRLELLLLAKELR